MTRNEKIEVLRDCGAQPAGEDVSVWTLIGVYFNVADAGPPAGWEPQEGRRAYQAGEVQLIFVGAIVDPDRYAKALGMGVYTVAGLPPAPDLTPEARERYHEVQIVEAVLLPLPLP